MRHCAAYRPGQRRCLPPRVGRPAALAEAAGLTVTWTVETPADYQSEGWTGRFAPSRRMPQGSVVGDQQINDHTIDFTVRPPGGWPAMVQDADQTYVDDLTAHCTNR